MTDAEKVCAALRTIAKPGVCVCGSDYRCIACKRTTCRACCIARDVARARARRDARKGVA